jgi:hypothetical protein
VRYLTGKCLAPILDHVFHDVDPEDVPEPVRKLIDHAGDDLIEDLMRIGVHVGSRVVAAGQEGEDDDAVQAGLLMDGWVSDIAFSDDVLHPATRSDEEILAEIEETTVAHDYEAIRNGLLGEP